MIDLIQKAKAIEVSAPDIGSIKSFVQQNGWDGEGNATLDSAAQLLTATVDLALTLAGIAALIMFLWGVFDLISSTGDENKIKKGKSTITWSLIGLVIIVAAKTIINIMQNLLNW